MFLIFLLLSSISSLATAQRSIISLGIWLFRIHQRTVIWTANREDPPLSRNATLILNAQGELILQQQGIESKFIANIPIYDSDSNFIWQTFYAPTDTILPGQEHLVCSISDIVHSSGRFALRMRKNGNLVLFPVEYPDQSDYFYWRSRPANARGNVKLNFDKNGLLYLLDTNGNNIRNLSNSKTIFGKAMYRATIDADEIFRLYSQNLDGNSNWTVDLCVENQI
ncbi:hypothetical protein MANES_06G046950v8 [Manihot esculenta]|uniref:Uncharacterized protein n=1 Tax=Manihot esculenta TaxID=3983 RepID=A0ACB7HHL2_MANES|nr:hypothetical protein MANES_06G046950v8 [Manihot esculenta]